MSYVVCLNNEGYPASLEPRKFDETLPDDQAGRQGLVRVIDESGEDYLYPSKRFAPLELRRGIEDALREA